MNNFVFRKGLVIGIIILFVGASVIPSVNGNIEKEDIIDTKTNQIDTEFTQIIKKFQKNRESLIENQEPYQFAYMDRDSNLHMEGHVMQYSDGDYVSFNVVFPEHPRVVTSGQFGGPVIAGPVSITTSGFTIRIYDHAGNPVNNAWISWIATYPTEYVGSDGLRMEGHVAQHSDYDYISFNVVFPEHPRVVISAQKYGEPLIAGPVSITTSGFQLRLYDHAGNSVDDAWISWIATYPTEHVRSDGLRMEGHVMQYSDGDYVSFNVVFPEHPRVVTSGQKFGPIIAGPVSITTSGFTIRIYDHAGNPVDNAWVSWIATYPTEYVENPNNPPNSPSNPSPSNHATGVSINTDISWDCSDPDGDPLTYDIYFGTTNPPPLKKENHGSNSYNLDTLDYNTKYYWKIVAEDNQGASTQGPIWDFTTSSEPNDPPQKPIITGPEEGNPGVTYSFQFKSTDYNGNNIYYWIDWGDNSNTGWKGPYPQGTWREFSHSWTGGGRTYNIKAKAKDAPGDESGWSDIHKIIILSIDYHEITLHPPWDSHKNGSEGNNGGEGIAFSGINYGDISAFSSVIINGWENANAWCEHSVDWVCPFDMTYAQIDFLYDYSLYINLDSSWGTAEAYASITFFINDIEYEDVLIDQSGGALNIEWLNTHTSHSFSGLTLNKGETYHIGVKAYVWTHVDMAVGGDCYSTAHLSHRAYTFDDTTVWIVWNNRAPNKPSQPDGPTVVKTGDSYPYTTSTTDPDQEQIWYEWDWGDGYIERLGPYNSGEICQASHTWWDKGYFNIKVRSQDTWDYSERSESLSVTVTKNKEINTQSLNFLTSHPGLFPIFQRLILRFGLQN